MWPKKIRNDEECERAVEEMASLMGSPPGSEEAERLELLSMLVGDYEKTAHPIVPPSPVEAIRFAMESQGLRPADLVKYLGSKSVTSLVMSGKRQLTLGMIRALYKGLGIPAEVLIQENASALPAEIVGVDFTRFPLIAMAKRGWLPHVPDLKAKAEEFVRAFAEAAEDTVYGHAGCFRQGTRRNAKDDHYSVEAWRLGSRLEASKVAVGGRYEQRQMTPQFLETVAKLSRKENAGIQMVRSMLAASGIQLIHVPHLPKTYLDGGVFFLDGGPVVSLTLRYDRIDYFWFTLVHDLAHLVRGDVQPGKGKENCLIEDLDMAAEDNREREADRLARDALISPEMWESSPVSSSKRPSPVQIISLAAKAGVHPAVVAGRWRHEHKNYRLFSGLLGQGEVKNLFCD